MCSTFIFGAVLALVRVAIGTPPACLIAAIGAQSNPSDLKGLCGTLESQVVGNITELCSGDSYSSATSIYAATCLASESVTISITSTLSSKSGSATVSAKTTSTETALGATTTGTGASVAAKTTGSGTAIGTATAASSTSTKTNSAGSTAPTFFLTAFAIGIAGLLL